MLVITDSNSYLRIARELHPLLGQNFGNIPYLLKIHKYFEDEYSKNSRLQNKFHWVNEAIYQNNRIENVIKFRQAYSGNKVLEKRDYLNGFKKQNKLSISNADIFILASAIVLDVPVLTDDPDMLFTADEFEIEIIKCIPFLKYMKEHNHADDDLLIQIFGYWENIGDCPRDYKIDLKTHLPDVYESME